MASPVTHARKQKVVDMFAKDPAEKLDPATIGVTQDKVKWKVFYDIDDILSFPTRNLFKDNDGVVDIQVDTSDRPDEAHGRYWTNDKVIDETAVPIASNV